ncbi:WD repeat-containing protein 81 isoform X2 [Plodia interpunctella]|uniref:WD repeat-containing protein 81 isoform X2 n=1 Tax=Plodia interpunctella TaxID=58824 RepID=UPI002368B1E4|nr:WD repeat-containing protein 81 isoform X2 [Plodia interpunctella]
MEHIVKELELNSENIFPTASSNTFTVIVHNSWLKKWLKNSDVDNALNNVDFTLQPGESVPYPWRKLFIKVLNKKLSKVLPLPRYKLHETAPESPITFSQLLQYVSQNNHRNLWKESYKKYCQNNDTKESTIVNLMEHDQLLTEVMLRLYGCNIIRIKNDPNKINEYKEIITNKHVSKSYETHSNLLAALFILETDSNHFVIYRGHYEHNLLDCLNFSPSLIDRNYARGMFLIYQLLKVSKAMCDRGLSLGMLTLQDIYLSENLWLQILPSITNNVHCLDASLIYEQSKSRQSTPAVSTRSNQGKKGEEWCFRNDVVQLEKLCNLWVRGRISNLDYLLHLNRLAGRSANDMQAHFMVPWVTDFTSRCGKNWRDLSKSKYRLNKGDRQLDMTYDVSAGSGQIPHHVTDALTDITCYVYLARRTPKGVLCKYVRNKWVPAEYPASVQRVQEWTPDECIPEFYTDPTVFKSIHEDLPDLGVPSWATCAEDFITKHREALESAHVSDNLHHWIDITFGYKLSGPAAIKAKNVCLSLVDGHTSPRSGYSVQLLWSPHPARAPRAPPPLPPRLHWTTNTRKPVKADSSDDISDDEEESSSLPQHVSRLHVPSHHTRSRHKSGSRARSLSTQGPEDSTTSEAHASHSRHYRVQRSELGKGIIYLPKEFNPVASIQAMESLDQFRSKSFFTKAEDKEKNRESVTTLNLFPMQDTKKAEFVTEKTSDNTAYTNHMFLASYDQTYLKKFTQDPHLDSVLKERKNRSFNTRYTTDAAVYKQFVTESRRQDMLVIGCLIVEIFLHQHMRALRTNCDNFTVRYNSCRTVLKYNFNSLPKCVSYIASLLLNVQPPSLSFKSELTQKKDEPMKKIVITDKGLPPPTPTQLLQPLLMQHLIPFPQSFNTLYKLLGTLHEYELTSNELNILYMYECDGVQCEKYQNIDKSKLHFSQKIAEGKIQTCAAHLDVILNQISCNNQFDVLDIFLSHYIELLSNKDTSVLAAWYLFDTVSKALGPAETRRKLLDHILKLYDDDYMMADRLEHKMTEFDPTTAPSGATNKQKFVKLYHNVFLLQLMVRLGLECFLDKFTQHLVEAVGGYKDFDADVGTPGHLCHSRAINKKPRYSDDNVKNALSTTTDIFSPDTSYGSEQITTPNVEMRTVDANESGKDKDGDNRSENEMFHFETDKEGLPSRNTRSKSPADSISSANSTTLDAIKTPSPSTDFLSPSSSKTFFPTPKNLNIVISKEENEAVTSSKTVLSPSVDIPNKPMFTSYLHFGEEESNAELRKKPHDFSKLFENIPHSVSMTEEEISRAFGDNSYYKISDMSSESLIWLAHRLGPVLTCRYITRNLLKMLTLCYIGKENLSPWEGDDKDEFDEISVINSRVVGDRNAIKVIKCLTAIVAMYGEQLIIFQYLPHMGELIASCRRRLSAPLEGGVVACLQLVKYLLPYMSDVKVMEQLQDTFPKTILQPGIRLAATSRCAYPSGARARGALARKLLAALHALALRVGPEMTRLHLAAPALQRFFLAFDKASGKIDNWPKQEETAGKSSDSEQFDLKKEGFLEICRDGSTAEWTVRDGRCVRADLPDLGCTPPGPATLTAQEELLMVFDEQLAYCAYTTFANFVGADTMERSLNNIDTIRALCLKYEQSHGISSPHNTRSEKRVQSSFSDEPISRKGIDITPTKSDIVMDHISSSNSFGSNVTLVGNRIDVATDAVEKTDGSGQGFDVVAYKMDNGVKSNRHLRGDWLIYWEHEIGRPEKENRFNLKQIKLQTFVGHTQAVKSIYCLDNEGSFMSGAKDKTVRLWCLRNQGDGNATSTCNWAYTGHKKGVVSLSFVPALRLAVSTDSVVHIWDPFMERTVSQLEHIKSPVSAVLALGGGSAALLAATTDTTLRLVDVRAARDTHDLKLPQAATTFIRCVCVGGGGGGGGQAAWAGVGLASGHVCVVDLRTGLPMAHFKAHDGEVLRLTAVDDHRILSSGLDQVTALWRVDDGELIAHLKGSTEPVHCLSVYYNELISGTTNNRIGVHTSLNQDASFSSTKLRSDTFKGVLTCMAVLPLNRLLLLGSDNGTISLLC